MRIALIHSFYSSRVPSGENNVVQAQEQVLRQAGHDVRVIAQRTDERLRRRTYPIEAALTVATGLGPSPLPELVEFNPDVTHLHNLFPNYGRRWLSDFDGPLVATLHNYRPLCARATLQRDGAICTLCLDQRSSRPAVKHGCFHDSSLATVPSALATRFAADPVLRRADMLTTLSDGMTDVFAGAGVPSDKLITLNNFIDPDFVVPRPQAATESGSKGGEYWIYAGRIEPEKGVHELIEQWPAGRRLVVAGEVDPQRPLPEHAGVESLGRIPRDQLSELMAGAAGLVFPSIWWEGLALVCLEALAVGTPIVTFDDIPAGRAVSELGVGVAGSRSDITGLLAKASRECPRLRERCREAYHSEFTPQAWLASVEDIYRAAIARRNSGSSDTLSS